MTDQPPSATTTRRVAQASGAAGIATVLVLVLEGTVFHPYQDSIGVWTDCTGHTGRDVVHNIHHVISPTDCRSRLMADLTNTSLGIAPCIRVPISDDTRAALISFSFNVGVRRFCTSSIARDLNAGHPAQACADLSRYVFAGGRDCRIRSNNCIGVARRRVQERQLCERGL